MTRSLAALRSVNLGDLIFYSYIFLKGGEKKKHSDLNASSESVVRLCGSSEIWTDEISLSE